ncbi:helix-turn-helix domain-containing protein [Clostridium perfringens]|uniref:helix-turn-helix domain-containing protein n=1 Tax=Clostridium perfringens TaxID=1502 RepID=UPI001ABB7340|nr:helix-turn-helix transcriptional regulator [Clostridium perfringens]MBO3389637.1 helix-turn-helix transcriptional regulator [Clostridium perfringens]
MLKRLREKKGITISFVARKLKIDRATVRKLEEGTVNLKVDWIPILSSIYGVSNQYIFEEYLKEKGVINND